MARAGRKIPPRRPAGGPGGAAHVYYGQYNVYLPGGGGGSRTPPTITWFNGTYSTGGANKTLNINFSTGDYILVIVEIEDSQYVVSSVTAASGVTFAADGRTPLTASVGWVGTYRGQATGNGTGVVVTVNTNVGALQQWGFSVAVVSGSTSEGWGARVYDSASTAVTTSLTRNRDASAVIFAGIDWNAGVARSSIPAGATTELATQFANYSPYIYYWPNEGTAGTTSYGVSGSATANNFAKTAIEVYGLAGAGGATVTGAAVLSIQSSLTAAGSNEVLAASALSGQSNLTTVATPTVFAASALSADTTMTAVGQIVKNGTAVLSGQSNLTAVPSVTVIGLAPLSIQATMATVGSNTVFAASAFTIQANLLSLAKLTIPGIAALSQNMNLTAVPSVTVLAQGPLSANLNLVTVGTVVGQNPGAVLSAQSSLVVTATVSTTGVVALSAQSSMTAVATPVVLATSAMTIQATMLSLAKLTVPGIAPLSIQSNMATVGTRVVPGIAAFSGQSNMTAVPSLIVLGVAPLSGQSNLIVVGKADVKAQAALSATTILAPTATLTIRGFSVLSGQSNLVVDGGTFNNITGAVIFTLQSGLTVVASVSPPWVWPLIEIDSNTVTSQDSSVDVTGWDSSGDAKASNEIIVIVTGMEGA